MIWQLGTRSPHGQLQPFRVFTRNPAEKMGNVWHSVLLSLLPFVLWALFAPEFAAALALLQSAPGSEKWTVSAQVVRISRDLIFGSVLWQPAQASRALLLIPLVLLRAWVLLWQTPARDRNIEEISYRAWSWLLLGSIFIPLLAAASVFQGLPRGVLIIAVPGLLILVSMGTLYIQVLAAH